MISAVASEEASNGRQQVESMMRDAMHMARDPVRVES
jgi:hypothetical protein